MKDKRSLYLKAFPTLLALALGANISQAAVSYLGSGTLSGPDLSGLTGTLEDGTAENQLGTGSGIAYAGYGNRFFVIPDRGPNASTYNSAVDNTTSYISRADEVDVGISYNGSNWIITPSLVKTTLFRNATALTGAVTPSNSAQTYFTGLSSGFDATNSSNSMRFDPEGIRISKTGNSVYVTDEYGPFVYEFDRNTGTRIRSIPVPAKFNIANPNQLGATEISGNTSGRVTNKGMEGLAISPNGSKLYGIMQSPLLQDNALTAGGSKLGIYNRILEIDVATGNTKEYVYPLSNKSYTVSEIVAINDHEFLVDERDGNGGTSAVKKTFYKIDITGATDVSAVASLPASGVIPGVTTVTKSASPFLDMLNPAFGLSGTSFPEKIEGIAFGPDLPDGRHTLVITNDNDFTAFPNTFYVFAVDAADLNFVPQDVAVTGPNSSQSPYLVKSQPNVVLESILTVGDSVNNKPDGVTPYRMVGIPDGLGAFDNGNGTFTVLMNHELGNASGVVREHGAAGAFVSKWIINKNNLSVVSGEDLIKDVKIWNGSAYVSQTVAFNRMCSADMPALSAFYDANSGTGYNGRIFMNGEEAGTEGRAFAHLLDGTSYELPSLGNMSFENAVANPAAGLNTVVAVMDDTSPTAQVYVYVGTKTNTGLPIDKAGLTSGILYGVKITGLNVESDATTPGDVGAFTLYSLGDVSGLTGAQLETNSGTNVTKFQRPEDGTWDPKHPDDFYFLSTASFTGKSRLWRLRFNDASNPALGGNASMLLEGTEGQKMMDNITINNFGQILIQEDPGNQAHIAKVWSYDIATDTLTQVAQHDPSRFVIGGANYLNTQDEESSGVIDVSDILGNGWYLLDVQAHYAIAGELVEGGQLLAMHIDYPDTDGDAVPDSVDNCPTNTDANQLNTDGDEQGNVCDSDDDNDGVLDINDTFPLDANESVDTDSDGTGNNADLDDDNDGMSDVFEITYGLNPLDASDASGDLDGDGFTNLQEFTNNTDPTVFNSTTTVDNDFDKDGDADLVIRSGAGGNWQLFKMNAGVASSNNAYAAYTNTAWQLVASEDFDGDGDTDILLRNSSTGAWRMFITENGAVASDSAFGAYTNLSWTFAAVADFNNDGIKDVLLHSTSGGGWRVFYVTNGSTTANASMALYSTGWTLNTAKDFDGDGDADIIMRDNSTGYWRIFTVQNGVVNSNALLALYGNTSWTLQAAEDLDNDGDTDIVMRGPSGDWRVFNMQNNAVVNNAALAMYLSTGWVLDHSNDVNNDGDADFILRNSSTGDWRLFNIQDRAVSSNAALGLYVSTVWQTKDEVDVNGDGTKDVIMNNSSSGAWRAFMINNGAVTSNTNPGLYQNVDWSLQDK